MAVRIRVRLKPVKGRRSEAVETTAVANTGYESLQPEIVIPARLARRLGFLPQPPREAKKETFVGPMGTGKMYFIPEALSVTAASGDREIGPVTAGVAISPSEDEVLLSDRLTEELRLVLLQPAAGLWKFSDDASDVVRESVPSEQW